MASGDTLCVFTPHSNMPPASAYATLDTRNNHLVLDFDQTTDESAIFGSVLPTRYGAGGLTVILVWTGTGVTTGDVVWNAAFERHQDETTDLDADDFAAVQAATGTTAATDGAPQYTSITFTNGAQMDSLAAGESFRLQITRDANNASDTMAADAELHRVVVKET